MTFSKALAKMNSSISSPGQDVEQGVEVSLGGMPSWTQVAEAGPQMEEGVGKLGKGELVVKAAPHKRVKS